MDHFAVHGDLLHTCVFSKHLEFGCLNVHVPCFPLSADTRWFAVAELDHAGLVGRVCIPSLLVLPALSVLLIRENSLFEPTPNAQSPDRRDHALSHQAEIPFRPKSVTNERCSGYIAVTLPKFLIPTSVPCLSCPVLSCPSRTLSVSHAHWCLLFALCWSSAVKQTKRLHNYHPILSSIKVKLKVPLRL